MKDGKRFILKTLIISGLLLLIGGTALYLFFDLNRYKSVIEDTASRALHRKVIIRGRISLAFLPHPGATVYDVIIESGAGFSENDMVEVGTVRISVALFPLLKKRIEIIGIDIIKPVFRLERNAEGLYNIMMSKDEKPESSDERTQDESGSQRVAGSLKVKRLTVSKGDFTFIDRSTEMSHRVHRFELKVSDLILDPGDSGDRGAVDPATALSFKGRFTAEGIETGKVRLSDAEMVFSYEKGLITVDPIRFKVFDGKGTGRSTIDLTGEKPVIEISQDFSKIDLEKTTKAFSENGMIKGRVDIAARLRSTGDQTDALVRHLNGTLSARGRDLVLEHCDIDTILAQYDKTQNMDAVDLGALLLAGPLGIVLTKGYDTLGTAKGVGSGRTPIDRFVSKWKISGGVAAVKDVAVATPKNRVAAKGKLDLVHRRFDDVVVAVLDKGGCAKYTQRIRGSFDHPRLETSKLAVRSFTGMFSSMFKKARSMLTKPRCRVFYNGEVGHPQGKGKIADPGTGDPSSG